MTESIGVPSGHKDRSTLNMNRNLEMLSLSGGALELDEVTSFKDPIFVKSMNGSETIGVKVSTKESNSDLKPQIQEEFSYEKTKFQRFRETAAFVGYILLGLAGLRSTVSPQRANIGRASTEAIMRSYEEMDSKEISATSKQFDAEIIIVDGVMI